MEKINPFPGQSTRYVTDFKDSKSGVFGNIRDEADIDKANIVCSDIKYTDKQVHKPVLDINMPVKLIPSTTPGHFHLFIDCPMSWEKYQLLLEVMAAVGIIEHGYMKTSVQCKGSDVRLPWIKK